MRIFLIFAVIIAAVFIGCSGGGVNPISSLDVNVIEGEWSDMTGNQQLWGLWQFHVDPEGEQLDVVELRSPDMHLNALRFLEPPAYVYLTIESFYFDGTVLEVDIGIRHPFLGLNQFTGFDVCGILISDGSVSGFDDPDLVMAGPGETRLLNADGYTRWWNPEEFPHTSTVFGYTDGLLGTPDSMADYMCTLNGYKYFSDELDPSEPVIDQALVKRGMFSAGQKNVRHYSIEIGGTGLIFNYAVDACWKFPVGGAPWTIPDDFDPEANRPEAWWAEVSVVKNSLWNDGVSSGGGLELSIDVYDWFDAGLNIVKVESPGNFAIVQDNAPDPGGPGFSTYSVDIYGATPAEGFIDVLISVESNASDYGGALPGVPITAYFLYTVPVAPSQVGGYFLVLDDPVQIIDPVHGDWPQLDDFSPTISESADGTMLVIWLAVNDTNDIVGYYEGGSNWGSKLYAFKSFDSGASWSEGQGEHGGIGAELIMRDALKSLPYSTGTRMHCVWPGYPSSTSSTNYVSQLEFTDQHHVFWKTKADRQVDAVIMDDLKLVVFSDYGHEINAQVSTGSDWDDPSSFWYPPGETHPDYLVADPGYISSVRSAARDEYGKLWLAYYTGDGGVENSIVVVSSPDGMNWTTEATFEWDPAEYAEVHDPSICIDGDSKYITYSYYDIDDNSHCLHVHKDSGSGFGAGFSILASYVGEINDIQCVSGTTLGQHLVAYNYATGNIVYCIYDIGDTYGVVGIGGGTMEASMPDFIFDPVPGTPDAYLHFVWCERDDPSDNWEVFYRRGYLELQ